MAIKLLKASGKLIFQLVILKKPNFQLMMMKNLIFSCPEKGRKRTNRDPWRPSLALNELLDYGEAQSRYFNFFWEAQLGYFNILGEAQ